MSFEIAALDALTYAGTALLVLSMAALAALAPAVRAIRVDPVQALRQL